MQTHLHTPGMYAYVTHQGTAMSETAICTRCLAKPYVQTMALDVAGGAEDWDGLQLVDASGNEALECIGCGAVVPTGEELIRARIVQFLHDEALVEDFGNLGTSAEAIADKMLDLFTITEKEPA